MDGPFADDADAADATAAANTPSAGMEVRKPTSTTTASIAAISLVEALPLMVPESCGPSAPWKNFAAADDPLLPQIFTQLPTAQGASDGNADRRISRPPLLPRVVRQVVGSTRRVELQVGLGIRAEPRRSGCIVAKPFRGRRNIDLVHLSLMRSPHGIGTPYVPWVCV